MLKQIQGATGLLFATFLSFHLLNTWLAAFGPAGYDTVQTVLRLVYQFAPVEALLLAALMVHLISGILRIWLEPKRELNRRARWHRYAGFFLAVFIGGHILAVRGTSFFYDVYPGFAGLAFSIEAVPGYFYPYYFLLAVAGFFHMANGCGIAAARFGWSKPVSNTLLVRATAGAALLTVVALGGFGGWFFDVGNVAESSFAKRTTGFAEEWFGVRLSP